MAVLEADHTIVGLTFIYIVFFFMTIVPMVVTGLIAYAIVKSKGYPGGLNNGFFWGFFLGVIGIIICICKPPFRQNNMFDPRFYNYPPPYNGQPMNTPYPDGSFSAQQQDPQRSGEWICSCGAPNTRDSSCCRICGEPRQS